MILQNKIADYRYELIAAILLLCCLVTIVLLLFDTLSISSSAVDLSRAGMTSGAITPIMEQTDRLVFLSSFLLIILAFTAGFSLWYFINKYNKMSRELSLMRKSHERYRFFTEAPPSIGIVRFDLVNLHIKDVNRAALRLLGRTRAEIMGKKVRSLVATEDIKPFMQCMAQLQSGKKNAELVIRTADSSSHSSLTSWHITSLKSPTTEPEAIAIVLDVTHKVKIQKERIEKEKLAGVLEMAGATAHELNQPLQAISCLVWTMLQKLDKQDPNYKNTERIYKEVDRMAEIARKISGISAYKVKKYVGETKIIDIDKAASAHSGHCNAEPETKLP